MKKKGEGGGGQGGRKKFSNLSDKNPELNVGTRYEAFSKWIIRMTDFYSKLYSINSIWWEKTFFCLVIQKNCENSISILNSSWNNISVKEEKFQFNLKWRTFSLFSSWHCIHIYGSVFRHYIDIYIRSTDILPNLTSLFRKFMVKIASIHVYLFMLMWNIWTVKHNDILNSYKQK